MASLGIAPRSQWRDRAGFSPASLFGSNGLPIRPRHREARRIRLVPKDTPGRRATHRLALALLRLYTAALTMRGRVLGLAVVAASLVSCAGAHPAGPERAAAPSIRIQPFAASSSPSPLVQVTAGSVHAIVPRAWAAQEMPDARYPQHGVIASPHIPDLEQRPGPVNGLEAFWIDEADVGIPSDYYYLVARGPVLATLGTKGCHPHRQRIFVDHPPDLTGERFSPSDFVASGTGVCRTDGGPVRWAYVVAAPGFGSLRSVGIPTSGLYVVIAAVSGARSEALLDEMINGAHFGNASIPQIERAAIQER